MIAKMLSAFFVKPFGRKAWKGISPVSPDSTGG